MREVPGSNPGRALFDSNLYNIVGEELERMVGKNEHMRSGHNTEDESLNNIAVLQNISEVSIEMFLQL